MVVQADRSPAKLVDLPSTWLADLVQHVASGAGGLASAAALSQTCKSFHDIWDSTAVTYRNLHLARPLHRLGRPFYQWIAKRQSRIAGFTASLSVCQMDDPWPGLKQLQLMFGIPGLRLAVRYSAQVSSPDDLFMNKVLRPHGHLIDQLEVSDMRTATRPGGLKLQDFCEAAAPCRSLDLTDHTEHRDPYNIGALSLVAGSLVRLKLRSLNYFFNELASGSTLSLLKQLTSLSLDNYGFGDQEPWVDLAGLTNLKQLFLRVAASGDPSPLSALTGLSTLHVENCVLPGILHAGIQGALPVPYAFSSLQPLSTMQQLVELVLAEKACSATSLHGLAELSRLKTLRLDAPMLKSVRGVRTGLTSLAITGALQLGSLSGIVHVQGLQGLTVLRSSVASLRPLGFLGNLGDLHIGGKFTSLGGLEGNLCTSLHSLTLESCGQLKQLSGIEGLTALQHLTIRGAGVTSLQPVGQLVGGLRKLDVSDCNMVQEEVVELPHIQFPVDICKVRKVKELVLAGGLRLNVECESYLDYGAWYGLNRGGSSSDGE